VTATFPRILELPSGLKLEVSLTPPGPVTELDEERGVASLPGRRLAVCLHPWARLGGNMDDPCVLITVLFLKINVKRHLVRSTTHGGCNKIRVLAAFVRPLTHYHKFYVLRYNARGVGLSSGWKSFTGLQEAEDLRELVKCAIKRLNDVREVVLIVSVFTSYPLPRPSPCPPRCHPRLNRGCWNTDTKHISPSLRYTGILKWCTYRVAAPRVTCAASHYTYPGIIPARTARTPHRIPHTDVSARPRRPRAPTRGARIVMPRRCG
jgi:hypothetical protein